MLRQVVMTGKVEKKTEEKGKKEKKEKADKKPETKTIQGGVQLTDHKVGNGPKAKSGDTVSMRYIGKLQNGKIFDQSTKGKPVSTLPLGPGKTPALTTPTVHLPPRQG